MAKSGRNNGIYKQDMVISQFSKDIYQNEKREWTNITEKCISQGENRKPITVSQVRISQYNPNNPLIGSKHWSKEKHAEYRATQKLNKIK